MKNFPIGPHEIVVSLWQNRNLIRNLVFREVMGRYKGSMLGIFWSLITPIFMLFVYTFVFSVVFKARWSGGGDSKTEFALVLFAGLLVFNLFSECITRAPGIILANTNYVKKVIFPLEILPWVVLGSALFHFLVSLFVWVAAYILIFGLPHLTLLMLPFIIFPFLLFVLGLSWLFASLGVFLRDLGQFIGIAVQVLMFMSPIFYPATALPEKLRFVIYMNPLTLPIEMIRDIIYWGRLPDFAEWTLASLASFVIFCLGFAWFQKTRKGFADVL